MNNDLLIRTVQKSDLTDLEWNGNYLHFRNVFRDAYQSSQRGFSILWIAEILNTGIIGQVFIQLKCARKELADGNKRAYLYSFRIKHEYQNQGIGSYMLQFIEKDLTKRGFKQLTLNVAKNNKKAQKLYFRHGYKVVAHEPGCWSYKDHQGILQQVREPAWRMIKLL